MLVSFPSGKCVGDVVNIQTNYQFTSFIVNSQILHEWRRSVLDYQKNYL